METKNDIHQLLKDLKEVSIVADDYRDERQDIEEEALEHMWQNHDPSVKRRPNVLRRLYLNLSR